MGVGGGGRSSETTGLPVCEVMFRMDSRQLVGVHVLCHLSGVFVWEGMTRPVWKLGILVTGFSVY